MTGIIISGHGNFGTGLHSALTLISGEHECVSSIDFSVGMDPEKLKELMIDEIEKMNKCKKIIICTDLTGGTPFKTAVELGVENSKLHVVSGTNLPTILNLVFTRDFNDDVNNLVKSTLEEAKENMIHWTQGEI